MRASASSPVSDENPLDLDQPSEHSVPGTQNVEQEVRDENQQRPDATPRRRKGLQKINTEWKEVARPEYQPFAQALRVAMARKGMSASDVAREIWGPTTDRRGYNVAKNRDRIGLYLAATSYPDEETLAEISRVLGVSIEELTVKQVRTAVNATAPGTNLLLANPGRMPRASGPSLTPVPGQPGKIRFQVDQIVDWRLAMKLFEELSMAAEADAEAEAKEVAEAVARIEGTQES